MAFLQPQFGIGEDLNALGLCLALALCGRLAAGLAARSDGDGDAFNFELRVPRVRSWLSARGGFAIDVFTSR